MTRVPERWDVGQWDEAHWDGQLGLDTAPGAITVNGGTATLTLSARSHYRLNALPGVIAVQGGSAKLIVIQRPPPLPDAPPGVMVFGTPKILPRW
jgi:hypothetical protein